MSVKILPGQGVGGVQFGQGEQQIIDHLGEPDKVYESEGSKHLQYFDLQIAIWITFEHNNKFAWAEVKNPEALLFDEKLIGEKADKVLSVVSALIAEAPEHEDYGNLETYFYESHGLELQFEIGRLRSINIGVLWIDNDTPSWP